MPISRISFVAHAQSHAAHNHYPYMVEASSNVRVPPSATPEIDQPAAPLLLSPGPAATVLLSPMAQAAVQALPATPSTETPLSPAPSSRAYDSGGSLIPPQEMLEGGQINLRG